MPQELNFSTPVVPGSTGKQLPLSGKAGTLTVQETAGAAATVTWQDPQGSPIVLPIQPLQWVQVDIDGTETLFVNGNGSSLLMDFGSGYRLTQPQAALQVSSISPVGAGSVAVDFSSPKLLYTCPSGVRAFPTGFTYVGTEGDVVTLKVNRISGGANVSDFISAQDGYTIGSSGDMRVGQGPGNDVVIPPGLFLLPGDTIICSTTTHNGTMDFEIAQEPL